MGHCERQSSEEGVAESTRVQEDGTWVHPKTYTWGEQASALRESYNVTAAWHFAACARAEPHNYTLNCAAAAFDCVIPVTQAMSP